MIFIDELDSLVPARGGSMGEPAVTERVVNTILAEMDGLEELNSVVVIGATNRPNLIDNILPTRPRATLVLRKDADHAINRLRLRKL